MTSQNPKLKIAMLISGNGTTMEAIIKACQNGRLPNILPALVISSNKNARGIVKARELNIKEKDILIINPKDFKDQKEFGIAIIKACKDREINFIGQYGWMVMTPPNVINEYEGRIVNQHNGPLDTGRSDFGGAGMFGLRVHQARLEFVQKVNRDFWTEATAHLVTNEFDKGAIVKRKQMPIFPNDNPESLQKGLLPIEHEVQIETLRDFSIGAVNEFHREVPLVLPGEESILEECKTRARKLYPNG